MVEETKKIKVLEIGYGKSQYIGIYNGKENEEVIHLDKINLPHVDVVCDVDKKKIPFSSNKFDGVYIIDVLHHIDNVIHVIEECHRVLKPKGKLLINSPHYTSFNAYRDLMAKHFFTRFSMDYFKKDNKLNFYSKARFKISCTLKPSGIGKFIPSFIRNKVCLFVNGLIDEVCFDMRAEK